jgi:hypothetical protein
MTVLQKRTYKLQHDHSKCGFNRHTKREVLFGPQDLGGAGFHRLFTQQGIPQTQYFLRHWRLQTNVGLLMQCSLAWFQLSTGMSFFLLDQVHVPLPHLESKWFASLRSFLATMNASIQVDIPNIPPKQREGDVYLMDIIINAKTFSNAEIRKLNYCRLYLKVVTLSDITKPNGEELDQSTLLGKPSLMSSRTKLLTIHQERPSEREWALWRRANRLWSDSNGRLLQPVKSWILSVQEQRQYHFTYIHRSTLYIRKLDTNYAKYQAIGRAQYRESSRHPCTIHQVPPLARPVSVTLTDGNRWQVCPAFHTVAIPQPFPLGKRNISSVYNDPVSMGD